MHGDGYCRLHQYRWLRWGNPLLGKPVTPLAEVKEACSIDDCDRALYCKGLCSKHYARLRQHGDPLKVIHSSEIRHPSRPPERVLSDFKERLLRTPTGCLEWLAARDVNGYGRVSWKGRTQLAHRVAYQLFVGAIPAERNVCHRCDNPPCCEPSHLFLGSQTDNIADMRRKGRGYVPVAPRGERQNLAKLTEEKVVRIRAARAAGGRPKDLAVEFGVSPTCIVDVCKRKTWKHVA